MILIFKSCDFIVSLRKSYVIKCILFLIQGFDFHVRNEHNMWSYVFFFIHLNDMKASDYTAIELFVSKLVS